MRSRLLPTRLCAFVLISLISKKHAQLTQATNHILRVSCMCGFNVFLICVINVFINKVHICPACSIDWSAVVVDEAHKLKNPNSQITQAMKDLKCKVKELYVLIVLLLVCN